MPVSGSFWGKISGSPFIVCFSKSQYMKLVVKLCILLTSIGISLAVTVVIEISGKEIKIPLFL